MERLFKRGNFSGITIEDLIKKKKSTSFAAGLLTGVSIGLLGITMLETINKNFTPLLLLPFGFLPILIMMFSQIKSINKELKSRKSNL